MDSEKESLQTKGVSRRESAKYAERECDKHNQHRRLFTFGTDVTPHVTLCHGAAWLHPP